jgi:hypothetical protein
MIGIWLFLRYHLLASPIPGEASRLETFVPPPERTPLTVPLEADENAWFLSLCPTDYYPAFRGTFNAIPPQSRSSALAVENHSPGIYRINGIWNSSYINVHPRNQRSNPPPFLLSAVVVIQFGNTTSEQMSGCPQQPSCSHTHRQPLHSGRKTAPVTGTGNGPGRKSA